MSTLKLSKADARRAFVRHHFAQSNAPMDVFERLRSIQFDPIAPVGCNHDLVLQARLENYRVGEWEKLAYEDRRIYDGWDKQASLVPFEGWPLRRLIHTIHRRKFEKPIFEDYREAVEHVLKDLTDRGPLLPKQFGFQERNAEWKSTWNSPNVTKRILRALWHAGIVMTSGRQGGQHLYDLAERVVPAHLYSQPRIPDQEAIHELALERHRAMGFLSPAAGPEVWSYSVMFYDRKPALAELARCGAIMPVDIEGFAVNVMPNFLPVLDQPSLEPKVVFIAPLDPFMWDRKMVKHLFGFDYSWEIYIPEAKRRWGYYVLPVLYGDDLVARAEFWCREGVLELRAWHYESRDLVSEFWPALEEGLKRFMRYCSAQRVTTTLAVDPNLEGVLQAVSIA